MELARGANAPLPPGPVRVAVDRADVDVSALQLGADGRVRSDDDFVFYNQPRSPEGAVVLEGGAVVADLAALPAAIERVVLVASGAQMGGLRVTAGPATHVVPGDVAEVTALVLAELYRRDGAWKVRAVSQGWASGLRGVAEDFGISVDDDDAAGDPAAADDPDVAGVPEPLVSLVKAAKVSTTKHGLAGHRAKVALVLDVSGSMRPLFKAGVVQALVERVVALACRFDDDGAVDVLLFNDDPHDFGTVTPQDVAAFTADVTGANRVRLGTMYGPAFEHVRARHFPDARGGERTAPAPRADLPLYVMFVTDGRPSDHKRARKHIQWASHEGAFWQFMAVGPKPIEEFSLLQRIDELPGRFLDNAGFFLVPDPAAIPEAELYDLMLEEYPGWLQQARARGLVA